MKVSKNVFLTIFFPIILNKNYVEKFLSHRKRIKYTVGDTTKVFIQQIIIKRESKKRIFSFYHILKKLKTK